MIVEEIWIENKAPKEGFSLLAAFDLSRLGRDDPARSGRPFVTTLYGVGDVTFAFVACIKGRAIYSTGPTDQVLGQGQPRERVELLHSELLRASP
jgi:hypothetical protein